MWPSASSCAHTAGQEPSPLCEHCPAAPCVTGHTGTAATVNTPHYTFKEQQLQQSTHLTMHSRNSSCNNQHTLLHAQGTAATTTNTPCYKQKGQQLLQSTHFTICSRNSSCNNQHTSLQAEGTTATTINTPHYMLK